MTRYHAHPRQPERPLRRVRLAAEAFAFLFGLVVIVAAMSLVEVAG